jgi:glycosyltransferase involved in cell wall biosynthesis
MKPTILALNNCYLPGYKGGGPVRSLSGLAERIGDDFDFALVTLDRDKDDDRPYPGVRPGAWTEVGKARVLYVPASAAAVTAALRRTPHDVLYVNSLLSPLFGILPVALRRLGVIPRRPLIVAIRGQLFAGALGLKPGKKRLFLALARATRAYGDAIFQATTEEEVGAIRRAFGEGAEVVVAANLPWSQADARPRASSKVPGALRLVFLSRLSAMKNLTFAVRCLAGLRGRVELEVWGPAEDATQVRAAQELAASLPPGISVRFMGPAAADRVPAILAGYDALLFPTLGENYGHVIVESLLAGCPAVLSDRTPWRDLEQRGSGWALPLEEVTRFEMVLQRLVDMETAEHLRMRAAAQEHGHSIVSASLKAEQASRSLFLRALGKQAPGVTT